MKLRHLLPAFLALPLCGCGFVGHTLGTVTSAAGGLIQTVTSPISGLLHAADEGSERAWREKADAMKREKAAAQHDRRSTQKQRRH